LEEKKKNKKDLFFYVDLKSRVWMVWVLKMWHFIGYGCHRGDRDPPRLWWQRC